MEIKTEEDYNEALKRLDLIFEAKKGTSEGEELISLAIQIEKYEDEHYPVKMDDANG